MTPTLDTAEKMVMPHNLSRSERRIFRLHPHLFEDVLCVGHGGNGCGYSGGISGSPCPVCGGMLLCKSSRVEAERMLANAMAFKLAMDTKKEGDSQ